ncbi:hypothetical protein AB0H34_23990 [Saccharopolyspora shandongensis]|uniref:hypothetical protein n=1 Tax=Saccharopolyspora shandongensis TaxID=418495 RepID=UPI0033CA954E
MADQAGRPPKVYVFSAQQPEEHAALVRKFAEMLRMDAGIDAEIAAWRSPHRRDRVVDAIKDFETADFHLVIASREMRRLMDTTEQAAPGDTGHLTAAMLRDGLAGNFRAGLRRTLPVVLPDATRADLPRILLQHSTDTYLIRDIDADSEDVRKLVRALVESPEHARPPRGAQSTPGTAPQVTPGGDRARSADLLLRTGAVIELGGHDYLIHGDVESPSGDGTAAVLRQARALRLSEPIERVWLRQVERKAAGTDAFAELTRERELLDALECDPGTFPAPLDLVNAGNTRTLVLAWPRRNVPPVDFDTLVDHIPSPAELDSITVRRTLWALAGLRDPLAALHRHDHCHRELAPHTIVRIDDEHLALRDLGAAGRQARPGEGGPDYQAPEQTRRRSGRVGPWSDVYRLAAVAYHLISGRLPEDVAPLPAHVVCPVVPDQAATAIDAALLSDPAHRPALAELATAFQM